ncbi:MAG: 6-phosphogluconolactonase [Flavobacteriaceae bacterium]
MPQTRFEGMLKIQVADSPSQLGTLAANYVATLLKTILQSKVEARIILATGTSQFDFLKQLQKQDIEWDIITVFHLDEYVGLSSEHPASFRNYLKTRILDAVSPKKVYLLKADSSSIDKEIEAYSALLNEKPIDIACVGIGENGHLAFNDPGVADFNDPKTVKRVVLDYECRQQQFNEGWFPSLETVPKEALTLTIPAIMSANFISCVVPELRKAKAVYKALKEEITDQNPASILRNHQNTVIFLDQESASFLK